ncbi:Glutaredoxin domain-containing protein [Cephalotus follicularis]|uniref:Glutaredoxin domain-containing protein n=1 Tax=Cephalotus follicularis TaxID=3775 RepID=A0A1Q3D4S2_CEPFO|nr:Glutaredoxin domain-containing protein [Cephalotus follicularis]
MQEAIPFKTYIRSSARDPRDEIASCGGGQQVPNRTANGVGQMVQKNAVVVFGRRGCCMCHVVKRLLIGLGVNPAVFDVDEGHEGAVVDELLTIEGGKDGQMIQFPVIFVGGRLFGGLERVMATHISGELVPILKDAGALWL